MVSSFRPARLLLAACLLVAPASAIVFTYPVANSIWTQGSANNTIEWAINPETIPPPLTQYMDIYIRNGIGSVYPAPEFLNKSIATSVDWSSATSWTFEDASDYIPAYGYQLFFSEPGNANLIYTDSEVFYINAAVAGQSSTTAASSSPASTKAASSSSSSSSSSAAASSAPSSTTTVAAATSSSSPSSSATEMSAQSATTMSSVTSTSGTKLHAATVPGGLLEQGVIGLSGSGASRGSVKGWLLAAGAGFVGYALFI